MSSTADGKKITRSSRLDSGEGLAIDGEGEWRIFFGSTDELALAAFFTVVESFSATQPRTESDRWKQSEITAFLHFTAVKIIANTYLVSLCPTSSPLSHQ